MTFTVTYRATDGALREERVEAASRAECVAECRRRGIAPKGIQEGRSGKSAASPRGVGGRSGKSAASPKDRDKRGPSRGAALGDARSPSQRRQDGGSPSQRRLTGNAAILAAVVLAAVAGGVWWWCGHAGRVTLPAERPAKPKVAKPKAEKPAKPAPATKTPPPKAAPKPAPPKAEKPKPLPPQRVGELRDGYRLLPDGTLHRVLGIVTNAPPKMSLADKTFKHSADVELGNLLMVEPGDDVLGDSAGMYRGFGKELDAALSEPIVGEETDTDLQRELKAGVIELREELKRRRDAGEDIEKVMEDARNQLKELSLYRQELDEQVRKFSVSQATQKDYEDLVKAANALLAERGVRPLELPATLKRAIRLRQIQEQAEEREREKAKRQSEEAEKKGTEK